MTSILIDVYKEKTGIVYVDPNNFKSIYELLDCRIITIETVKIGGDSLTLYVMMRLYFMSHVRSQRLIVLPIQF